MSNVSLTILKFSCLPRTISLLHNYERFIMRNSTINILFLVFFLNPTFAYSVGKKSCDLSFDGNGEWGDLETVIVGNPIGARFPSEIPAMLEATLPAGNTYKEIVENPGKPFPEAIVKRASEEIAELRAKLEERGVEVLQPEIGTDFFAEPIVQPDFAVESGLYAAMPRDNLLFLPPNKVILSPMAWRSRYREHEAYRDTLKVLSERGYEIIEAPRPRLSNESYNPTWSDSNSFNPVITNVEPLFDAADFIRFGQFIIAQESHVTNRKGISWVRSQLPDNFNLHVVKFDDSHPMHIDASILPLRENLALINPTRGAGATAGSSREYDFKRLGIFQCSHA